MNVNGKVISVELNVEVTKKDGGVYQGARLTYRGDDGRVQEQAFHNNAFKYNAPLKVVLSNLAPNDNIVIEKEKKGEFWNVVSITKQGAGTTTTIMEAASKANPAPKSTYATAEERAQTQVYIIRQSSVSSAVNLAATLKLKNEEEVLKVAKKFEAYVTGSSAFVEEEEGVFGMQDDYPE
ncbi:MAG: hypothetical protein JHC33_14300 [Ignisphaera sp.]|nr:hypothetical protein [Ignisphaera sp.]